MAIKAHITATMAEEELLNAEGPPLKEISNEQLNLTRLRPQAYRSDEQAAESDTDVDCGAATHWPSTASIAAS
jgi:hypothetical protein